LLLLLGGVGSAIFGLGLDLANFPKNHKLKKKIPSTSKKISSGWVKKYPGQSWVGLLFTAGQKYAQVRARLYYQPCYEKHIKLQN